MGEFDNKPAGEPDLLEEDGTVWMSGGASNALDDDLDEAGAPPAERFPASPAPVAPTQPYTRRASGPQRDAPPARAAVTSGQPSDRPSAASGETSGGSAKVDRAAAAGLRHPMPTGSPAAEPSIQVSLTDAAPASANALRSPRLGQAAQPRQPMPTAPVSGPSARGRMVILLALLVLAIAALVWRLAAS